MKVKQAEYQIAAARWPEDTEAARTLLTNYGQYLKNSPGGAAGVCLPGYDEELRGLPGKYAAEGADLLLARVRREGAGCVAIARIALADGVAGAEIKRLWVEPLHRGHGLGRGLVEAAVLWARAHGCGAAVLDTVNEAMPEAAALYRSMGFEEIARFNESSVAGIRFYQLRLG